MFLITSSTATLPAHAGPIELALDPVSQETGRTCQSYSMALAIAFHPRAPVAAKADSVRELREMERRIRDKLLESAKTHAGDPTRVDWAAAVKAVTNNILTVEARSFASLDEAMRFVGESTGVKSPSSLGQTLAVALVKTPVMLSFTRIAKSNYAPQTHIATIFGVDLPPATMTDQARPRMLILNSAVKYAGGVKNLCAVGDLSDNDRYRASVSLIDDYEPTRFNGQKPYLVTWIQAT